VNADAPGTALHIAERHVREGQQRIARQREIIEEMERDGHKRTAQVARTVLVQLVRALEPAQQHLREERAKAGSSTGTLG
jgi:DNA-binding ferritin-like protein